MIFYDGHDIHFDYRELYIICRHNIQYFILKLGDSVNDQPNYYVPNKKLKNLYDNTIVNGMIHHVTVKFSPLHMNYALA